MTETELKLIAAAAIIGLSSNPNQGYSTPAAIGTPRRCRQNAKNRFWRMFAIVWRDSRRARTMPAQVAFDERHARAFHRDVGPGAHRDADVGRGQRRRVVDAVAGHRDRPALGLQLRARPQLVGGQHFRHGRRRCRAARATAFAVVLLSPVAITMRIAVRAKGPDRIDGAHADRISDAEQAGGPAIDRDEHDGLAFDPLRLARRASSESSIPRSRRSPRLPTATTRSCHTADDAFAGA